MMITKTYFPTLRKFNKVQLIAFWESFCQIEIGLLGELLSIYVSRAAICFGGHEHKGKLAIFILFFYFFIY